VAQTRACLWSRKPPLLEPVALPVDVPGDPYPNAARKDAALRDSHSHLCQEEGGGCRLCHNAIYGRRPDLFDTLATFMYASAETLLLRRVRSG